jgi:hypothetical protein
MIPTERRRIRAMQDLSRHPCVLLGTSLTATAAYSSSHDADRVQGFGCVGGEDASRAKGDFHPGLLAACSRDIAYVRA